MTLVDLPYKTYKQTHPKATIIEYRQFLEEKHRLLNYAVVHGDSAPNEVIRAANQLKIVERELQRMRAT